MPEGSIISKYKPGGILGQALSLGHLGQTGSLGCGRGWSLRFLGWCMPRLRPLSLLFIRSHALLQPEHLANSARGEGEWAAPVGEEGISAGGGAKMQAGMRTQVQIGTREAELKRWQMVKQVHLAPEQD